VRSAVKAWRQRAATASAAQTAEAAAMAEAVEAAERPFRRALVVSLLNPKAILFDLAFLTQFVSPHAAHPTEAFALLSTIVMLFSAGYLSVLIFTGHRLATAFRRRKRLAASMTGGIGSLFLGFALKLATASLGAV
jgi:leucine efflux protein